MTAVDTTTGEIVPVNPSSEVAVTSYLQHARDWLATAVEETGPEQIAAATVLIATAALVIGAVLALVAGVEHQACAVPDMASTCVVVER